MDRISTTQEQVKPGLHELIKLKQINSGDNSIVTNQGQPKASEYSDNTASDSQPIKSLAQLLQKEGDYLTIQGPVKYPNGEIRQIHETTQRGKDGQLETINHLSDTKSPLVGVMEMVVK